MAAPSHRLTIQRILRWADEHSARTGRWPTSKSGEIPGSGGRTWKAVNSALAAGRVGESHSSSTLARLLAEHRGVRNRMDLSRLTVKIILSWADAWKARTGEWPRRNSGPIPEAPGETWRGIGEALLDARRGLPRSSLAQLLERYRGKRNPANLPPLSFELILHWADQHMKATGRWPTVKSGEVMRSRGEKWAEIDMALRFGKRGLTGGYSLSGLLKEHRGHQPRRACMETGLNATQTRSQSPGGGHETQRKADQPPLTVETVLQWADEHHKRTGRWPTPTSVRVVDSTGDWSPGRSEIRECESWGMINRALLYGHRGLPAIGGLCRLLQAHGRTRETTFGPPLTEDAIVAWAKAYLQREGRWPVANSEVVEECPPSTWQRLDHALQLGQRGLPGGSSLAQLLEDRCGRRHRMHLPPITIERILAWADAQFEATGRWPETNSGAVHNQPGETWLAVSNALREGTRGLSSGQTIHRLLLKHRGDQYRRRNTPLDTTMILDWAASHHELTGALPTSESGKVIDEPRETWIAVDTALRTGWRMGRRFGSLDEFLSANYTPPYEGIGSRLSVAKILQWAREYLLRVGEWPTAKSAFVDRSRTEKWSTIDAALRVGYRGLPGGSSLAQLLVDHTPSEDAANSRTATIASASC